MLSPDRAPNLPVQVELQSIQPFYTAQQKSPFKAFPWKQGCMHFKFLTVRPSHQATLLEAVVFPTRICQDVSCRSPHTSCKQHD